MDISPKLNSDKFQCLHCQTVSQQTWFDSISVTNSANHIVQNVFYDYRTRITDYKQDAILDYISQLEQANKTYYSKFFPKGLSVATCISCGNISLWVRQEIMYPKKSTIAPP